MNNKKKLNRKDFLFQNGWFQTKIKKPKQLVMQQFQISDCQQCNILLLDSNACVYVDSCKYCNIFIGPSQSSIFIRDCQYINVVSISQQFRVRDSYNCKFSIFCQSQPIIQSSHNLIFNCYPQQFTYKQLKQQIQQAKLNPWNNNWFDIYDFTPNKFNNMNKNQRNYKLSSYEKQFITFKQIFFNQINQNSIQRSNKSFIPQIQGKVKIQTDQVYSINQIIFLVINPAIQPYQLYSLVLHSRFIPLNSQIEQVIKLKVEKNTKILFIKIKKQDQSRWRQCQKVVKVIKNDKEKQTIQNTVFAPFKDQH